MVIILKAREVTETQVIVQVRGAIEITIEIIVMKEDCHPKVNIESIRIRARQVDEDALQDVIHAHLLVIQNIQGIQSAHEEIQKSYCLNYKKKIYNCALGGMALSF